MTRQAASVDELIGISETCICNIEAPDVIKPKKGKPVREKSNQNRCVMVWTAWF